MWISSPERPWLGVISLNFFSHSHWYWDHTRVFNLNSHLLLRRLLMIHYCFNSVIGNLSWFWLSQRVLAKIWQQWISTLKGELSPTCTSLIFWRGVFWENPCVKVMAYVMKNYGKEILSTDYHVWILDFKSLTSVCRNQ